MEEKLKLLITEEGIEVDEGFDEILSEVMEKATDSVEFENLFQVSTNPDAEAEKEFFAIFIEQQLQGRNLKAQNKFSGMRWRLLIVRLALLMKMCSLTCLDSARSFVELPGDRILYDYSHIYDVAEGCQMQFVSEAGEKVAGLKYDYQKNLTLRS